VLRCLGVTTAAMLLGCTAPPQQHITVDPTLDFGAVIGGTSVTRAFKVVNEGPEPVPIDDLVNPGDSAFVARIVPFLLQPGDPLLVPVQFNADSTPLRHDHATTLLLSWGNNQTPISVSATSTFVDCSSVRPVTFAAVLIGTTAERPLTVVNTASVDATVQIGRLESSRGEPFDFDGGLSFVLSPGESHELPVRFKPTRVGVSFASVAVEVFDGCSPENVQIEAVGATALLTCNPMPLEFGAQVLGTTQRATLSATNDSLAPVALAIADAGDFAFDPDAGTLVVPPLKQLDVPVLFTPRRVGPQHGAMVGEAPGSPACLLQGTGF
jgi:hypothetical protein